MLKLIREDISSSFSDLWYRVNLTTPRLAPHARLTPQRFGERNVYIIEDPAGGSFYRLSESAYFFVGLLDGQATVEQAWEACCTQLSDAAPTQKECVDVLSKLQYYGLLSGDLPLSTAMVERRQVEVGKRRRRRRFGGALGLSLSIPLINPERFLSSIAYLLRAIFSLPGLICYLLAVAAGTYSLFAHRESLGAYLNGSLAPENLVWMSLLFIFLRGWHELGHAAACKAMGGRCTEIGLMLIAFLFPFPYCDTSSAWRFPQVYKRVIVSAGGMLFETFIASLAAILWANIAPEYTLARTLLFNTVLLSGVTTVLFNANPLLRYDGYFILSDMTGVANLAQRAKELTRYLWLRFALRVASARAPTVTSVANFWLLLLYDMLATPYRLLVTAGIVLALWSSDQYLTVGTVIAVLAGCIWIVWPALKLIGFLVASPKLLGRRARALLVVGALASIIILPLSLLPVSAPTYATGTIEPVRSAPVRPAEDGFVEQVLVKEGQEVALGDPLFLLRSPELRTQFEQALATEARALAQSNSAAIRSGTSESTMAQLQLVAAQQQRARLEARVHNLTILAAEGGRFTPTTLPASAQSPSASILRPADLEGRFIGKGTLLGTVISSDQLVVRALVDDAEYAYVFSDRALSAVPTSFRVRGDAGVVTTATISRATPMATRSMSQRSLSTSSGGEVDMDPADPDQLTSRSPHFVVELAPSQQRAAWQAGLRARIRFDNPPSPLAAQWWRSFQQRFAQRNRT